eukprot:437814_1
MSMRRNIVIDPTKQKPKKKNEQNLNNKLLKQNKFKINQYYCIDCTFNNKYLYHDVINNNINHYSFYNKYVINMDSTCFGLKQLNKYISKFTQTTINNNKKYRLNTDMTIQKFYKKFNRKKNDNKIGLFWEFVRYFNCEWAQIYIAHFIGKNYFENQFIEYNLKDFANND